MLTEKLVIFIIEIHLIVLAFIAYMLLCPSTIKACDIPVFKYALTYWSADPYGVIVFHKGSEEKITMDKLQKASSDKNIPANVSVKTVDLTISSDPMMQKIWKDQTNPELPWMVLKYPRKSGIYEDIYAGRFNDDNVTALLDSPIRKEITQRLTKGEAGVWILLESGNTQQDDEIAKLLKSSLDKMSTKLKTPIQNDGSQLVGGEEINVAFSMVRISRKDPKERVFIQMLLHSESDLRTISKPMAFPIFGRGRVLYALVGDGINKDNIQTACSFIMGWCSCQVKDQNPGLDMLMSANWNNAINNESLTEANLLSKSAHTIEVNGEKSSNLKRNILIALLAQFMCIGVVTCVVIWKRKASFRS
jgi:hypothetical protein